MKKGANSAYELDSRYSKNDLLDEIEVQRSEYEKYRNIFLEYYSAANKHNDFDVFENTLQKLS